MGFLETLGSGLRYGGSALAGALSNDVYREQAHERGREKEAGRDRQAKIAETMLRAAHSGQIPPEHLPDIQRALSQMGYELPLSVLSPTPEARERLNQYAREQTARGKLEASNTEIENMYDVPPQAPGLGVGAGLGPPGANTGLRGGAPEPIPQVALPPPPRGMPAPEGAPLPQGVQTFPLAPIDRQMGVPVDPGLGGFTQDQQDQIADTEALSDNPDYPPEMIPPGPPTTMREGEIGQLQPVEVVGRRTLSRGSIPPIVQDETPPVRADPAGPGPQEPMVQIPGGPMIPRSLLPKWKAIVQAKNAGSPAAEKLYAALLDELQPKKADYLTVGEGQSVFDPRTGKIVHQGQPKTSALSDLGKLMSERAALAPGDPNIAEYDRAIGAVSQAKAGALSDLGKLTQERAAVAAQNPNAPELAVYDRTIANYKQAANAKDDTFKNANVLRDEFNQQSKTFASIAQARRQIIEAARNPTAAGDLSLLYGYMKSLDPNSVVRESEFAMAAQAGSLPQRIQGWASKVLNGERLPDSIRADFVNQSAKLYDAAVVDQQKLAERYRGIAERNNLPPEDVLGDFSTESKPGGAAPGNVPSGPAGRVGGKPGAARKTMTIQSGKDAGDYYQENGKWFKK